MLCKMEKQEAGEYGKSKKKKKNLKPKVAEM